MPYHSSKCLKVSVAAAVREYLCQQAFSIIRVYGSTIFNWLEMVILLFCEQLLEFYNLIFLLSRHKHGAAHTAHLCKEQVAKILAFDMEHS